MPSGKNVPFWSNSCKLLYSDHDSFLSKPQLHSHSQRYDLWMLNWWLNEAHLMWDFACTSKTMIMMIMKNINTVVLWPLRPASLMHKNPPKCTNIYGSVPCRTQRSRRWRCFFFFFLFMWFLWLFFWPLLTMHFSLRLCCALQKNIFYPPGHIKAQAFFKLGLLVFWTGTQWFWSGTQNFSQDEPQDSPYM